MWHIGLGLLLTKKCNADCDICCFSCSPRETMRMPLEKALNLVDQAAEIPSIKSVGIAGGEAFLYFDDIVEILKECKKKSLSVTCTTNGFWGVSEKQALEKLSILKKYGVRYITLSVDDFHSKFIPYDNIRNILRMAKKIDMEILVTTVSTRSSKRLSDVAKNLGDDLLGFNIVEVPCTPVGNAAIRIKKEDLFINDNIPNKVCEDMKILSVTPDGYTYSCCSEAGFIPALSIGSAYDKSLKELTKDFFNNKYCYAICNKGVRWIYNTIKENNLPIKLKDNYVNMCDMCNDIFKDREAVEALKPFIEIGK